jgi:hypothetical protein
MKPSLACMFLGMIEGASGERKPHRAHAVDVNSDQAVGGGHRQGGGYQT